MPRSLALAFVLFAGVASFSTTTLIIHAATTLRACVLLA
jgi:hypothetical protein